MDPDDWQDVEHNPTYQDMMEMKRRAEEVCHYANAIAAGDLEAARGYRRLAMFCSDPGLGKTYLLFQTPRRMHVAFDPRSGMSPGNKVDLCYKFWEAQRAGYTLTIFNDVDHPARSE